jgi:hypothetical protein
MSGTPLWYADPAGNTPASEPAPFNTSMAQGPSTHYVAVRDALGCVTPITSVTVHIKARPKAEIVGNPTICKGDNTELTVNFTGTPNFTFTYTDGINDSPVITATSNTYIITPLSPNVETTYTLVSLSDAQCTALPADLSGVSKITVNDRPVVGNLATIPAHCAGETISPAKPPVAYNGASMEEEYWEIGTSGGTFTKISIPHTLSDADNGKILRFTAKNSCGTDASETTLTVISAPTVDKPAGQNVCNGENSTAVTFTSSAADVTYRWENDTTAIGLAADGTTGNIPAFKAINPTNAAITATITVTPTAAGACPGVPATFTITVNPTPEVTIENQSGTSVLTCTDSKIDLTATGGVTYLWDKNLGNSADAIVTLPDTYTVTVTDANGCINKESTTITQNIAKPTIAITPPVTTVLTCATGTIELVATGNGISHEWTGAKNGTGTTITADIQGKYTVTATGSNGCINSTDITITENKTPPTAAITANPVTTVLTCTTQSITLTASGGVRYAWESSGNSLGDKTGIDVTTAGTYNVTAIASNGCSSNDPASITITENKTTPNVSVKDAEICLGGQAVLTASGANSYTWVGAGVAGASITVSPATTTTYTVEGTAANGCPGKATATVYVETPIEMTLLAPPSVELGNEITITISTGDRDDHVDFEWFINDQPYRTLSENTLTLRPDAGTQHFLVHTVTANLNCPSSSDVYVEVTEFVPNAINPYNPSGINCCFMRGYGVEIYNRYMQKVFEGSDGWDGTYRGAPADPGTYFYRIYKKSGKVEKGTLEVVKF